MTRTRWIQISLLFAVLMAVVGIACRSSEPSNASAANPSPTPATSTSSTPASQPASTPANTPAPDAPFMAPAPSANNSSPLKPPKGYKVAIVVFEDMQCPQCGRDEPLLKEAEKTYKIPLVRHDFPLPMHNWSFDAHVLARYFDSKSKELGEEWRHFVFTNQASITKDNLRGVADRFAADHGTTVPFAVDPTGQFKAEILSDFQAGQSLGVQHTPTIYIVSDSQNAKPYTEVTDTNQMFQTIDQVIKQAGGTTETAEATGIHRPTRRPPTKKNAQ